MADLKIAIGLPASGKSTYGEILEKKDYTIVSSDKIREEVFGDVNDQTHNTEVFNIVFNRIREVLKTGGNVYLDATNLVAKRRINIIKSFKNIPNVTFSCALFVPPYETCLERNSKRDRKVPEEVIAKMLRRFEPPHYSEGFDKIEVFGGDSTTKKLKDMIINLAEMPHDNPHHTLSIGEHMLKAEQLYIDNEHIDGMDNIIIAESLLFHDLGKKYTKTFTDYKGNPTKEAHYYNHNHVSAYLFLTSSNKYPVKTRLEMANLIDHHMDFYSNEAYLNKVRKRYGEEFFNKLLIINKYDKAAH
jgi:predicted kinase